ncbi:MAG: cupin domain-containing protein [bacterium]
MTAEEIIRTFDLQPHPEGGFYRESYRSPAGPLDMGGGRAPRSFSTCIYYLLTRGDQSRFHRLASDEIFHFYRGDPVTWILLPNSGEIEVKVLGSSVLEEQQVQLVVPAGTWFGGFLNEGGDYALMGTTVAPGFDFDDFELADREKLLARFSNARDWIARLT